MMPTKHIFLAMLSVFLLQEAVAQYEDTSQSPLDRFNKTVDAQDKFDYFFEEHHKYGEHSAYDWLDIVNGLINTKTANDSISLPYYKVIQAQLYYDIGDYDKSIALAGEAYKNLDRLHKDAQGRLLQVLDAGYERLELYSKQLEIRKQKKDLGFTDQIVSYDIYSNLGLHRKAMEDYIMDQKKTLGDNLYFHAVYHNNVGNYLRLDNSASVALIKYREAKGHIEAYLNNVTQGKTQGELLRAQLLKGVVEGNIGKCYAQLRRHEEAIPWLESSIGLIQEFSKGKHSPEMADNMLEIADCYLQVEDYDLAKEFLDKINGPISVAGQLRRNALLAGFYDRNEDYKNAAFYLKKNVHIRDSMKEHESELKKQQLATVVEMDLAMQKKEMEKQKEQLELSRTEIQAKDERINFVFISLIFALLGFTGLGYAYLKSVKNQRLIAEQNHIIEASLVEKDSLLKEIHHRVKNNLQMVSSLLSLQTKNTKSKAAIDALEEGKSRVKAMALIHQKLYQNDDLSVIEMQSYIESLINSVQSVFKKGGHNINITIDAEGVELDIDRAIPFGLILNELVSNSFKYAFPENDENGKIYIHLRKNDEKGYFEYTDNGVGLPEDAEDRVYSSMGIRLMNRLVNQLQSSLNIGKPEKGVRFWFYFK
jgi:two-component sensor histidine kinase